MRAVPRSSRGRRILLLAAALVALVAGYFLWFRDSPLVAVSDVEVVGIESAKSEAIEGELVRVAEGMTTLHPDVDRIEAAAAAFPTIASVEVDFGFPHSARIEVTEHEPTAVIGFGEAEVAVAPDGTLLRGIPLADEPLPRISSAPPAGARLEGAALDQALILGAAPAEFRPLIERVSGDAKQGIAVTVRGGIPIRFGDTGEAAKKWRAAAAVLADPKLDALCSLDVRVPSRPAAGCAG
jgi:cell division protein FtsQ